MTVRGARRRRAVDRGFVLSDHADWPGLQTAIRETQAEKVYVTHGTVPAMVRYLRDQSVDAYPLETTYVGESNDRDVDDAMDSAETAQENAS